MQEAKERPGQAVCWGITWAQLSVGCSLARNPKLQVRKKDFQSLGDTCRHLAQALLLGLDQAVSRRYLR